MKKSYKYLVLSLACLMTASTVGNRVYAENQESSNDQLSIWGTYTMERVIKSPQYNYNNPQLEAKLDVAAANGEAESGQIIITTGDRGVKEYKVETADLKNKNGDVYKAENVEVFNQWYVFVEYKSSFDESNSAWFPAYDGNENIEYAGYIPDALIPQKYSIQAKENYIDPNANQGITFDFNVPVGTPAGEYTGEFTLKIDGKNHKIPVTLTVWGYDVSETHGMNLWDIAEGCESLAEMSADYKGLYDEYYDALLKYKLNGYHVGEADYDNEEFWMEDLKKYWDNPAFNGVFLPDIGAERSKMYRYFAEIAKACVEDEINYFEAIRFYHQAEDEPHDKPGMVYQCIDVIENTNAILNEIAQDLQNNVLATADGDKVQGFNQLENALQEEIINSIVYMPQIVTSSYSRCPELYGIVSAYSPGIRYYYTDWESRMHHKNAEITNGETWCYTSWAPHFQNPNFHLDDFLYAGRVIGWMRKDWNIYGYLNWMCNLMVQANGPEGHFGWNARVLDPYTDPLRLNIDNNAMFTNGDGYMFYPMKKYHADSPIPSMRLVVARDGQEDYDTLFELEEGYQTLANSYGVDANFAVENLTKSLSTYYEMMYNKNLYTFDGSVFERVRHSIGGLTDAAYDASKTMIMQSLKSEGANAFLSIYSLADEVYVNGKKLTKTGNYYAYTASLMDGRNSIEIEYKVGGERKSFEYILANKMYKYDLSTITNATAPTKGESIIAQNNGALNFKVVPFGTKVAELVSTRLDFVVPFSFDFTKVHNLNFVLKNTCAEDIEVELYVKGDKGLVRVDKLVIFAHETYHYTYKHLYKKVEEAGAGVNSLIFRFPNYRNDSLGNAVILPEKTLCLYGCSYSLK